MSTFDQFISTIKANGVARSSHFFCNILPPPAMAQASQTVLGVIPFYVEGVNLPEMTLSTKVVKDAGLNREVVVDKLYGTCTMTFHSDSNMSIKMFFDEWLRSSVKYTGGIFAYPDTYTAETLTVFHVDVAKNVTYVVNMYNAYPKIVDDVSLSAQDKSLITFKVLFVYESWDSFQFDRNDPATQIAAQVGADVNARNSLNIAKSNNRDNLRRAMNLVHLIRTGANKDAIKSGIISIGTRKINNIIGTNRLDDKAANSIDKLLGAGSGILEKIDGIFR